MKTFLNQIKNACKDYGYFNVVRTMQLKDKDSCTNTKVAIVSIVEDSKTERYYTIFYKYVDMKKPRKTGCYRSIYSNGKVILNGYIDACKKFIEYAY